MRLGKRAIKGIAKGSKTLVRLNGKLVLLPDFRFDVYTFLQHKMPDELDNIQKLHDKIVKHKVVSDNFTVEFAELLVKAGEGRTQVLAQIGKWDKKALNALSKDLKSPKFAKEFFEGVKTNPGLVESWKIMSEANVKGLANKMDEIVAVSDDITNVRKLGYENWLEDLDAFVIWTSRTDPDLRIMQKINDESMYFYTRSTSNQRLDDLWQGSAEINDGWVELDFKVASDLQGQGIGTSMFNEAMAYFSKNSNINGVKGLWLNPSNYDDAISVNYSEFWDFYNKSAKTIENANEAALNTATGKWVVQWANGKGINITPYVTILDGRVEVLFKVID